MHWRAPHKPIAFTAHITGAVAATAAYQAVESEPTPAAAEPAERERFEQLLTKHWHRAYLYAYRLTGNPEEAEDLLQQAAEEAYRAFYRYQPGTRFDRWLLHILHNSFVDLARRRRRHTLVPIDALPPAALVADESTNPEVAAEAKLADQVQRAVRALRIQYRGPVVLVDLMGLSYQEAAEVLRCPVGTVRSRLHRGRLILRQALAPYLDVQRSQLAG